MSINFQVTGDLKDKTLRDENFISQIGEIHLEPALYKNFIDILEHDLEILEKMGATDYSFLLGVHEKDENNHHKWNELHNSNRYHL